MTMADTNGQNGQNGQRYCINRFIARGGST